MIIQKKYLYDFDPFKPHFYILFYLLYSIKGSKINISDTSPMLTRKQSICDYPNILVKISCKYHNHEALSKKHTYIILTPTKKVREKFRECHNHKPQPFPDPKRKRKPTSTNRTNVRKALRLTLSSPSKVIAILKGLKNTRTKWHTERHTTNRLVE